MADKTTEELSLADTIVGRETSRPSALTSRKRTKGIMAQEKTLMDAEPEYEIPSYVQDYVSTIQEERTPQGGGDDLASLDSSSVDGGNYAADDKDIKITGSISSFVKQFEGFHDTAYWDQKQWSIGYGTKASGEGATITSEEAEKELNKNLKQAKAAVVRHQKEHGYDWSNNQVDALSSFVYNLGSGQLSNLTQDGTRGDEEISTMILEYNKAGGKTLPGLVKRRKAEAKLFTQGYDE